MAKTSPAPKSPSKPGPARLDDAQLDKAVGGGARNPTPNSPLPGGR